MPQEKDKKMKKNLLLNIVAQVVLTTALVSPVKSMHNNSDSEYILAMKKNLQSASDHLERYEDRTVPIWCETVQLTNSPHQAKMYSKSERNKHSYNNQYYDPSSCPGCKNHREWEEGKLKYRKSVAEWTAKVEAAYKLEAEQAARRQKKK